MALWYKAQPLKAWPGSATQGLAGLRPLAISALPSGTGRLAKGCRDMAAEFNIKPHEDQWRAFTRLMTFSIASAVVILGLMALALL